MTEAIIITIGILAGVAIGSWITQRTSDGTIRALEGALNTAYRELEYAQSRNTLPRESSAATINARSLQEQAQYAVTVNGNGALLEPDLKEPPPNEELII